MDEEMEELTEKEMLVITIDCMIDSIMEQLEVLRILMMEVFDEDDG